MAVSYVIPVPAVIEALDLAFVKYRLVTSDTLEVVNIPEDVIAEASCALDTAPVAPPTDETPDTRATLAADVILPNTSTVITGIFKSLP